MLAMSVVDPQARFALHFGGQTYVIVDVRGCYR